MNLIDIFGALYNENVIEISSEYYGYKVFYDFGKKKFICVDGFNRKYEYSDTNLLNLLNATINREDTKINVID